MTFIPSLTFAELWVVSMEHLQRVRHAIWEPLPLRTPGSVCFLEGLHMLWLLRLVFPNLHRFYDIDTKLDLYRLRMVSMEHLRRVWHASRERLPFRTPGSVPLFGICLCSNCWDQIPRTCHVFTRLFTSNIPIDTFSILLKLKRSEMQILVEYVTVSDGTNIEACDMCNRQSFIFLLNFLICVL